ncbi:MAG TPA: hypothetical protein VJ898_06485 [Natrialbaceae archaeon]|nr:hypothetical protein [Natrialbaceae archaeon]
MAEDDHAKYRPDDDDDDGDGEGETEPRGSSRDERQDGKYVHAPAVDLTEFEADETRDTDRDGGRPDEREADRDDGSAAAEPDESAAETTDADPEDVEWAGAVGHAAGVETPVPRNLTASIVAVFSILGGGMALLGLLFAGIDLVVLDSFQLQVSLLSSEVLVAAIPAQAGVIAVLAGFYAGTREEGTEAVVAAAAGTFLGVVVEVVLVTVFVSTSANLALRTENLVLTAAFLGIVMAGVTAGSAVLYGRYITHPDGLLGALSDRLATEERRGASSRTRK